MKNHEIFVSFFLQFLSAVVSKLLRVRIFAIFAFSEFFRIKTQFFIKTVFAPFGSILIVENSLQKHSKATFWGSRTYFLRDFSDKY